MGRLIGIDYGVKRTGLAVTDPERRIAGKLQTLPSGEVMAFIETYLANEQVDGFVIGYPRQMNNRPSESAAQVKGFARALQLKFPDYSIYWMDERFTSKMAFQAMIDGGLPKMKRRDKGMVDAISAVIILESFLSKSDKTEIQ